MNHKIIATSVTVILLLSLGTIFFHGAENWSYLDSFYFSTMTLTTIGYGDFVPTTPLTKIFTSFYSLLGVGIMLYLLGSVISNYVIEKEKHINGFFSRIYKKKNGKSKNNTKKNR